MEEILVPIALFAIVPVIVGIVSLNGRKRAADLQATVQKAIEKGVELSPETIRALGVRVKPKDSDLRFGVVLLAVAIAFIALGASIGEQGGDDAFSIMLGISAFPGFIGLALIGLHFMLKGKQK